MHHLRRLVVCLAVCVPATPAWAALQSTSTSLAAGAFDLGLEVQGGAIGAYEGVGSPPLSLNLHEAVGLANGFDLQLWEGFGLDVPHEVYIGAAIKWTLLRDGRNRPGLALFLGGHYITDVGAAGGDATLIVDHNFGRLDPYAGLRFNMEFTSGASEAYMGLLAGCRIGLGGRLGWFVEGGLGFLGDPKSNYLSTGPRIII